MGLAPRGHLGEEASWGLRAVVGFRRVEGQVDRAVIPKRAGARETERKGLLPALQDSWAHHVLSRGAGGRG